MPPAHKRKEETAEQVRKWAAVGVPIKMIAERIGIADKTLSLHYGDELRNGAMDANANIAGKLYQKAMNGDTTAMIFWCKTRMGWREKHSHEITGEDGGPISVNLIVKSKTYEPVDVSDD